MGFLLLLRLRILLCVSSSSLLIIWLRLELNMLAILPILRADDSFFQSEVVIKYFISQRLASIIFLSSILIVGHIAEKLTTLLMACSLLFKLGSPPFHGWFVGVLLNSNYRSLYLITTIQKAIPLSIIRKLSLSK